MKCREDAVKGSSALKAGLDRRLMDEVAVLQGKETAAVYWDIEKFYDSIDWVRLVDWCLELFFPARLLEIAMSLHMAQRVLKIGECYSEVRSPSNSVVAGCTSAIWLSRIFVCSILREVRNQQGCVISRNFFGDMVSIALTQDPEDLIVSRVDHAAKLAGQIAGARLSFNKEKSCVVASSRWASGRNS